jgi:Flp pilus assembly protein TadG
VLPIFLAVLAGLIDFGVALGVRQTVTHAAAEGARAAIGAQIDPAQDNKGAGNTYQSDPQSNAWDRAAAAQALSASSSFNGSLVSGYPTVATCSNDVNHKCITVEVKATNPVDIPLFSIVIPSTITSTAVVQVQ